MSKPWPRVSLGELLRLERRRVNVDAEKLYQEIGIYCFGRGIFHKTPRTGFEVGDKDLFLMKEGDFILQVTFAWEGAIAIVSAAEDGMFGSTRYPTFRVDESRCVPHFLLNYFRTEEGLKQLVKICPGSAGRNRVLSIRRIPEVLVPLPPLVEQRRVVARIEELAAQIRHALIIRDQAAEEAAALSHSYLSSLLRAEETRARWPIRSLSAVAEINPRRGKRELDSDSKVTFVPMRAVSDETGQIVASEARTYAEVKTGYTRFEDGDVIFARITPCMQNGKSAVAAGLRNGVGFGSTEFHVVRPGAEVEPAWLHHLFRHREFLRNAAEHFTGTAGQQRVPVSYMREKTILVPPLPEQRRIVAELDALQAEVDALKRLQAETAAELDALLPAILDRAFKGEL
ncbi:MAG: restriction endonuclease subunit S [Verrucomicrobia bacterium]|nr:restriction endonuclease subunit S [Verrucomicrobiota bacterium]